MKVAPRTLLVMHADPAFKGRLAQVAEGLFDFQVAEDWPSVRKSVQGLPPASVILVDPYMGQEGHGQLAPELHDLLIEHPSATVIAALHFGLGSYHDVWDLSSWGIAEIVQIDEESTPEALRRVLRAARSQPLRALLVGELPIPLPGRARAIMDAAVETVTEGGHPKDLARSMSLSIATLRRWCESSRLPPPRSLLVWMRVLLAAALLDDPGHTVYSVATACGYSSDQALRRAIKRVVKGTPSDLREIGAFETVSEAFFADLANTGSARNGSFAHA
jgi:AraC-like DNA-binding protein